MGHILGPANLKYQRVMNLFIIFLEKNLLLYKTKYAIVDISDVCKSINLLLSPQYLMRNI